jgi:hypothetical protein
MTGFVGGTPPSPVEEATLELQAADLAMGYVLPSGTVDRARVTLDLPRQGCGLMDLGFGPATRC